MAGSARNPETFTFGQQLGFADLETLPKGMLGRAVLFNDVNSIGTAEVDLLSITNVSVPAGREVWAHADFNVQCDPGPGAFLIVALRLYQGGTLIGSRRKLLWSSTDFEGAEVRGRCTQGSGLFTVRTSVAVVAGTATTAHVEASTSGPGFLTVEDVGPSF